MKRKISLITVMTLLVFSMVGCGKAKSNDDAKVDNSTTQKTESVTKKEQVTTEVKKDEPSKSEEASSEVVASGEVKEDNNEVKPADNGGEVKEPEKSEEVKNEVVSTEPAATEPAKEEPTKAETPKEEINKNNCDKAVSFEIGADSDIDIVNDLISRFGVKSVSKGDVINLSEYCDWDALSSSLKSGILNGIGTSFELNSNHDMNDPSFVFNVYDSANLAFGIEVNRRNNKILAFYCKK